MTVSVWWLLAAVSLGVIAGMLLFALFAVEREADTKGERPLLPRGTAVDDALGPHIV
jgi:hypothetical protein